MRPITIVIEGDFWDSFLYRGQLFLWGMDNSVSVVDWNKLALALAEKAKSGLLHVAIAEGERLYGASELAFLADKALKKDIIHKLNSLSQSHYHISSRMLGNCLVSKEDSPFSDLTDDIDFYFNRVYGMTDKGVFSTDANKNAKRKTSFSQNVVQVTPQRGYSLRASSKRLAIACGENGVYEVFIGDSEDIAPKPPKRISKFPAKQVSWQFASLFASDDDDAILAGYNWDTSDEGNPVRKFERFASEEEIFGDKAAGAPAIRFGSQEKLYRVAGPTIQARRFQQRFLNPEQEQDPFSDLGAVTLDGVSVGDTPVFAGVGAFGVVVQYADKLVVGQSTGEFSVIKAAVAKTRVFPKSIHYEGHLHAILDSGLTMQVFAGDFMVQQKSKQFGIEVRQKMLIR